MSLVSAGFLVTMLWQLADGIPGLSPSKRLGKLMGYNQEDEQAKAFQNMAETTRMNQQLQTDASKLIMKMVKDMQEVRLAESKRQFDVGTQLQRESTKAGRDVGLTEAVMRAMPQLTQYQPQFLVPFNPQYPNASSIVVPGQL